MFTWGRVDSKQCERDRGMEGNRMIINTVRNLHYGLIVTHIAQWYSRGISPRTNEKNMFGGIGTDYCLFQKQCKDFLSFFLKFFPQLLYTRM